MVQSLTPLTSPGIPQTEKPPTAPLRCRLGLLLILACYFPIVIYSSARLSPTYDETPHIHSGLTLMSRGAYTDPERIWWTRLDLLHPIMDIAPALLARAAGAKPDFRDTFFIPFGQIRAARWAGHLCGALMLVIIYFWGEALWGAAGALLATAFLACYPTFLAHSSIVSSDILSALGTLAAAWMIWHVFISRPERVADWGRPLWLSALAAGVAVAFAICCKLNNILFVGVTGMAALWAAWHSRGSSPARAWLARGLAAGGVSGVLALTLCTIIYEATHRAAPPITLRGHTVMLPFGQAFLASVNTARKIGIAQPTIYYAGALVPPRPWHYAIDFLLKTPLTLLPLAAAAPLAALVSLRRNPRPAAYAGGLLAGMAVFCATRNVFAGMRYMLAAIVLLALLTGALGAAASGLRRRTARALLGAAWLCLGGAAVEMALATPWQLSYFNPLGRGRLIFADSELDWGQGLIALKEWQQRFSPDRPIWLSYFGTNEPADFGVRYRGLLAPYAQAKQDPAAPKNPTPENLAGEVVAIGKTQLAGSYMPEAGQTLNYYRVWRERRPDAEVGGGSIAIFDLRGEKRAPTVKPGDVRPGQRTARE